MKTRSPDDEILIYPLPVCTARFLTTVGSASIVHFLTTAGSASTVYFLIIGYYASVVPADW
ncbi:putative membrane protein [Escherichia coli 2-474-04_S1_C1]|nr:putative membrane protein [Escherichia coli 2-474-04_S1_C1]